MNPTLEYIYNHPKETKRIIGIVNIFTGAMATANSCPLMQLY